MLELMLEFPEELRNTPSWLVANDEKAPCHPINGHLVPVNPAIAGGLTFTAAYLAAEEHDGLLGFYLSKNDPFGCIDLDVKDPQTDPDRPDLWTTPEEFENYRKIMEYFDTYAEVSRSGKGLHLWFKGNIGAGCRRGGIELYTQERFLICTGKAINRKVVADRQDKAVLLAADMRQGKDENNYELVELEPVDEDWTVYERAQNAVNKNKFIALAELGDWQGQNYPSQSEADLSLMSMFAFYSKSNEQCRRLFRLTSLGKREKANKNNYHLDRQLRIIRMRQELEEKESRANADQAAELVRQLNAKMEAQQAAEQIQYNTQIPGQYEQTAQSVGKHPTVENPALEWPPGIAGELAKYVYFASMRPVKEIAIVTALGALAGILGKAYNIPKSGLNMYFVLVARSAIGKEALHGGLSSIQLRLKNAGVPGGDKFFDFTNYVSGPSLVKAVVQNPCFINVNGEWGKQMRRMAMEANNSAMQTLKTQMTNLYQKSDSKSTVGGMGYSNKENNVASATGVAYSMIGESTPETFFESLTREMMEDGFLSRFNIVEYDGKRVPLNEYPVEDMDNNLFQVLCTMTQHAFTLNSQYQTMMVGFSADAKEMLRAFDIECDDQINGSEDEAIRQIWNRAHLKVMRMAALLAVADNYLEPVVQFHHADWALALVRRDMNIMFSRWQQGAIGMDDETRIRRVVSFMVKYFGDKHIASSIKLHQMGIVPRSDIQKRVYSYAAFRNHRNGANVGLEQTLRVMLDMGLIVEVDKVAQTNAGFRGKGYFAAPELFTYLEKNPPKEGK